MRLLITRAKESRVDTLEDLLLCVAANVEDSLVSSGAQPGKDYSRLDLFKLAQPFALHILQNTSDSDIALTTGWPSADED